LGIAFILSGLSKDHRDFLRAGGYGFIIGDGNLDYGGEFVTELYYSLRLFVRWLWVTPDYQFILHPAYNKDRGPVHAFGIRVHVEI
jgi:high affinity Mn2+ porin